jgi:tetratricopeptide (TPR) repeat protein
MSYPTKKPVTALTVAEQLTKKPLLLMVQFLTKQYREVVYRARESVGQHKRDIVVSRVEETSDSLQETKEQFTDALENFKQIVRVDEAGLGDCYRDLKRHYDKSEACSISVHDKIKAIEEVSEALFKEWEQELDLYTNRALKAHSRQQLKITKLHYKRLIKAMKQAEMRIKPVLLAFRDQVLFMKHNLNAQAIAALQHELAVIGFDIAQLIAAMEKSITEANDFVFTLVEQKSLPHSK